MSKGPYSSDLYKNGLFIFRRDLRIEDNIGLLSTCKRCENLYCCFIFTPEQITSQNKYKSDPAVQFMMESLQELNRSLSDKGGELLCFYGTNDKVLNDLVKQLNINCLFFNRDYTPYARERDSLIQKQCEKLGIGCELFEDYYLYPPGTVFNGSGTIYQKFKPFYEKVLPIKVFTTEKSRVRNLRKTSRKLDHRITLRDAIQRFSPSHAKDKQSQEASKMHGIIWKGGRSQGLRQLMLARTSQKQYEKTRDIFDINTSLLSAHLKFGTISVREVYWMFRGEFGKNSEILRQLIWREFYAHILYGKPGMINPRKNNPRGIKWNTNRRWFQLWCEGRTGFPIVDAAMRQLNQTGWMHNRGRLVVAIFLTKVLLIDWRWGEQYFATKLVDYDIASNNGNWQWVASTGADSMPYFRTMNPWTQAREHDPKCKYIKKWVPELNNVDNDIVLKWDEMWDSNIYLRPIVDFSKQRLKSLELYKT